VSSCGLNGLVVREKHLYSPQNKILIVDDEENIRLGMTCLLGQEGYEVLTASDGQEALQILDSTAVTLVISDINMPGMNGMHLLREMHRSYPGIDVVMMTAYGEVESYLEAIDLGAFEYIHKPVKMDELRSVMKKLENKSRH